MAYDPPAQKFMDNFIKDPTTGTMPEKGKSFAEHMLGFVGSASPIKGVQGVEPALGKTMLDTLGKESVVSAEQAFKNLGNLQRDIPERAMLEAQKAISSFPSGNALGTALEHVGDLTHRMSEMGGAWNGYGAEYVAPKIRTGLSVIQNAVDSGRIRQIPQSPELTQYAEAHSKLPVYNQAQYHAREAAVALGKRDLFNAEKHLEAIQEMLKNGTYEKVAGNYEPNFGAKTKMPSRLLNWKAP